MSPVNVLVSGKRIFDVVKELEGTIACTLNPHQLTLQAGDVHLSLNIKDAENFLPFLSGLKILCTWMHHFSQNA